MPKGKKEPVEVRFWRFVEKTESCWLWRGGLTKAGYGQITVNQYPNLAHRLSWQFRNGQIESGMEVCHSCDNRACCNPDHLFLGSHRDNLADMARKFRSRTKLTAEQVKEIRDSKDSARATAKRYGLKSHKTIYNIKNRLIFQHVP
jgi:hypothetical protein